MKSRFSQILLVVAALIGLNVLASFVFFRADLTEEKRYSLSEATERLLVNLDADVYVKIYLDGELPPGFQRLQNAIRETLDEMQAVAGGNLNYRFIEPASTTTDPKKRSEFYQQLAEKGIVPTNVIEGGEDNRRERLIFPGAVLSYKNREVPVLLLKGNIARSPQENLNLSYENVEFQLATALRELTQNEKKKIGLLTNYTRVPAGRLADLIVSLQRNYDVYQVNLTNSATLDGMGLDAVMVVKPDTAFSEADKFKLDQFIVKGGRALFFVDALKIDSVGREGTYAYPAQLNLDDLLFNYGIRLNVNIVKDLLSAQIPLNVGNLGDKPQVQLMPWRYFPLLNSFGNSPIVRNLDAVYCRFAGTLDTVRADGITKTPLLLTSRYTQLMKAPALVTYNDARQQPDPRSYQAGPQMIACLLEGRFESLYNNQILPGDPRANGFRATGEPSKIVVCSDGDLPLNDFDFKRNVPLPLGFDRFSADRHIFSNKEFILNAVDYLIDENGVITARNKEVRLRPLDALQVRENRSFWQGLNLAAPLVLIALLAGVWQVVRRGRFAR
ncbi:MAG: gliding motility-associated ABC transporter substrate-binding protein GldG [Cytophagaceae bacterium]|nr:gliding motility-associated ABC transporter substrate-binding protein GldG [Cytophagaceae bacterium]